MSVTVQFLGRIIDWGFALQVNLYDFDGMNRTLEPLGFPKLDLGVPEGVMFFRINSFKKPWLSSEVSFGTLQVSAAGYEPRHGKDVNLREFDLSFRTLYDILYKKKLTKLYPFWGLGFRYQYLRIYEGLPNGSAVQAITNDIKRTTFGQFPMSLELGLGIERGFVFKGNGLFVGLRGGYLLSYYPGWSLEGDYPVDLKKPGFAAPFVAVTMRSKEF